jgi:hypothetical protein
MDVSGIANLATSLAQTSTSNDVSLAVFKKALDAESSAAVALIAALPPVQSSANLPAHLGQNINTTA